MEQWLPAKVAYSVFGKQVLQLFNTDMQAAMTIFSFWLFVMQQKVETEGKT